MRLVRRLVVSLVCLCLACGLSGCVESAGGLASPPRPPFVRAEHLCANAANMRDVQALKKDLANLLSFVDAGVVVKYYKPYDTSLKGAYKVLEGVVNLDRSALTNMGGIELVIPCTIVVSDSMVSVTNAMYFTFDELMEHQVTYTDKLGYPTLPRYPDDDSYIPHPYSVLVKDVILFSFANQDLAQCVAAELAFIRQGYWEKRIADELAAFQPMAEKYRAMSARPQVSEEQRKYIVQANSMTQRKEFGQALEFYERALAVDPFSYPAAYYNMALISAQEGRYLPAIVSMQKYLLLAPAAEDARSAQDKIYEWEAAGGLK